MDLRELQEWVLAELRNASRTAGECAQAAADGLPAGFPQVDDVIVLLQPIRLGAADEDAIALEVLLRRLAEKNFLTGTQAVAQGGLGAALVRGSFPHGFHADLTESEGFSPQDALLGERTGRALVSARPKAHVPLANFVERGGQFTAEAIGRVMDAEIRVRWMGTPIIQIEIAEARART